MSVILCYRSVDALDSVILPTSDRLDMTILTYCLVLAITAHLALTDFSPFWLQSLSFSKSLHLAVRYVHSKFRYHIISISTSSAITSHFCNNFLKTAFLFGFSCEKGELQ